MPLAHYPLAFHFSAARNEAVSLDRINKSVTNLAFKVVSVPH